MLVYTFPVNIEIARDLQFLAVLLVDGTLFTQVGKARVRSTNEAGTGKLIFFNNL
ncbi:hypothetical protein CAL7102_02460 [Dulcicalothrix desertica PCC 7102]|nr:hypothetical protein CAL7102_02460 [Dulcicalothrix desertica PCC 7102]